jgi:TrmH family RNA methyltransferase
VVDLLVAEDMVERHADLLTRAASAGVRVCAAPASAVADLSDTVTPQGIVAVCRTVDVPLAEALAGSTRLVVLCDRVRDPGNLGTVIRCADAFGADAVLVGADSVDVYNAKAVRASTGSLFHLPLVTEVDLATAVHQARSSGLQVLGAAGGASSTVDDLARSGELARPTMWVLGNEAWGLPADRAALLDRLVGVPMYGRAESLNLSTAAAVLLYATATAQH